MPADAIFELFVLFAAAILLLFHRQQPVRVIFTSAGVQGHGSYIVPFIVALALELTLLCGFESAGFFSEEVRHSRREGPRAIVMACIGTAVFTGLFAFAMLLATPKISAGMAAEAAWVPQTLHSALGTPGEDTILAAALVALVSTAIANMGVMTRLIFGMSRDRFLPAASVLGKVSTRTGEPYYTVLLCVILSFIPILIITKITVVVDAVAGLLLAAYVITRRRVAAEAAARLARPAGAVPARPMGLAPDRHRAGVGRLRAHGHGLTQEYHQPGARPDPGHLGDRRRPDHPGGDRLDCEAARWVTQGRWGASRPGDRRNGGGALADRYRRPR